MSKRNCFYYLSDIHTEFYPNNDYPFIPVINREPDTKYNLLCAGDIGLVTQPEYWRFISRVCDVFDHVYVVHGNHEYYEAPVGIKFSKYYNSYVAKCEIQNLTVLDNTRVELEDCVILGTTLWSHVPRKAHSIVTQTMTDYRKIRGFSVEQNNDLHAKAVKFLEEHLTQPSDKPIVVVTHHAPSFHDTSAPEFTGRWTNYAFATDLTSLVSKANIWIYGHTH